MNTKIISFTEYLFWGIINNFYSPIRISVIVATKTETSAILGSLSNDDDDGSENFTKI